MVPFQAMMRDAKRASKATVGSVDGESCAATKEKMLRGTEEEIVLDSIAGTESITYINDFISKEEETRLLSEVKTQQALKESTDILVIFWRARCLHRSMHHLGEILLSADFKIGVQNLLSSKKMQI